MADKEDSEKVEERLAHANLLYRSGIEIYRMLDALYRENCPLFTEIGEDMFLVTRLLGIDFDAGDFIIAYGEDKATNNAIFEHDSLIFNANHQSAQLVFKASNPTAINFNSQSAIKFDFPKILFVYHHRAQRRIRLPSVAALRCFVDEAGILPFEARVVDISHDGIGFISYATGITLPAGSVLKDCRIVLPSGVSVVVDLMVRHSQTIERKDGTLSTRTGVRFMQKPEEIRGLIDMFVKDIDQ